ncbi:MAG: serine/threonine-protein kinase [Gammaproteobacteria bacterium]
MTLKAGKDLGHYRIVRKLGSGGMADVYEAQDLKLGRTVALKILPPELMRNPEMVARFQTEVRAAASLNHRSIVTVFEVGMQDDVHFYSMRLLTGGDLRGRIKAGVRPIEALAILRELSGAFEHAHGRGFVHRDVKPENVLFDDEGLPLLTDFGIAKALGSDSNMTGTGVAIGTPRYFSPEQARGKPVDARSDLYSLGIILHEMLTGKPPYNGEDALSIVMKHVNDPIPVLPEEHAHLQPLLEQLMAKDPAHRIASAKELRKQISGLGGFASLTPQPINLGEESELVQRLLSGETSAHVTPAPTSAGSMPTVLKVPPVIGDRTTRGPAPQGGAVSAPPRKAQVEQIIPYRGKIASAAASAGPAPAKPQPPPAGKGTLKLLVASALLGTAGVLWFPVWQQGVRPADWIPAQVPDWIPAPLAELILAPAPVPAPQAKPRVQAAPQPAAAPVTVPTPASASPGAGATAPAKLAPASTPAPQLAPAPAQKSAPAVQPKPVPAPAPATLAPAVSAPQTVAPKQEPAAQTAAPRPEPAPATVAPKSEPAATAPAPAPVEQPAPARPQPQPAPAIAEPPAPAQAEPEASSEEDDFLRQRAEQLKLERERREAARKKAAEEAARRQEQEQKPQAPAEGEGAVEPAESPPPQ